MAYHDTLFQLGMDLTRSSTTQKEDVARASGVFGDVQQNIRHSDRKDDFVAKDHFVERDGVKYAGTHLIIDLFGAKRIDDVSYVEETLKRCVDAAGATLLHIHLHRFSPDGGLAGVAMLAESHISVHSWPSSGYAAFDVFMCGEADAAKAVDVLREAFSASSVVVKEHRRGSDMSETTWQTSAPNSGRRRSPVREPRTVKARKVA